MGLDLGCVDWIPRGGVTLASHAEGALRCSGRPGSVRRSEVSGRVPNLGSRSGIPPGNPFGAVFSSRLASGRLVRYRHLQGGEIGSRTAASHPAGPARFPYFLARVILPASATRGAARGVPGNVHDVRLRVAGGRSPLGRALRPSRARMYNSAVRCPEWAGRVLTTRPFSVFFGGGAFVSGRRPGGPSRGPAQQADGR